jgi:transcriptional regulator with XRE-family HTH domain
VVKFIQVIDIGHVNNVRNEPYLKAFGNHLRACRKKAKMSQEQLGLEAEIGKNQIGNIERGEVNVTLSTLKTIADALKIQPKNLLEF